jgi:hypothetical protein
MEVTAHVCSSLRSSNKIQQGLRYVGPKSNTKVRDMSVGVSDKTTF